MRMPARRLVRSRHLPRHAYEEDRHAEDALERAYQPAILLSASVHTEALQHLGRGPKPNCLTLLLDREGRQENRNQTILAERDTEFGMASDLKDKPAVPPLVEELILRKAPDRQSTKDE